MKILKCKNKGISIALCFTLAMGAMGAGGISVQAKEAEMLVEDCESLSGNSLSDKAYANTEDIEQKDSSAGDTKSNVDGYAGGNVDDEKNAEKVVLHAKLCELDTECSVDASYADSYAFVSHNYYHILGFKNDPSECTKGYYPILQHMVFYRNGEELPITGVHTLYTTIPVGVTLIQVTSEGENRYIGNGSTVGIEVSPDAYRFCYQIMSLSSVSGQIVYSESVNEESTDSGLLKQPQRADLETDQYENSGVEEGVSCLISRVPSDPVLTQNEADFVKVVTSDVGYREYMSALKREGVTNPLFEKQKSRTDSYRDRAHLAVCLWIRDHLNGGTATIGAFMNNPKYTNYERIDALRQEALEANQPPEAYLGVDQYISTN